MSGQFSTLLRVCNNSEMLVLCLCLSFSLVYNKSPLQLFLRIQLTSLLSQGMESLFLFFNTLSIMHALDLTGIPTCKRKEEFRKPNEKGTERKQTGYLKKLWPVGTVCKRVRLRILRKVIFGKNIKFPVFISKPRSALFIITDCPSVLRRTKGQIRSLHIMCNLYW